MKLALELTPEGHALPDTPEKLARFRTSLAATFQKIKADGMRFVLNDEQGDEPGDWCICETCTGLRELADKIERGEA
jgi:hypothetical protein